LKTVRSAGVGDLYCTVVLETPVKLSSKQKTILRDLQNSMGLEKNSPKRDSWFKGVKKFFDGFTP
jgi:molecular chaperone DnaJ